MFTIFNINFLKRHFYLRYTKVSLHTASITRAQEFFCKSKKEGKKVQQGMCSSILPVLSLWFESRRTVLLLRVYIGTSCCQVL